MRALIGDLQPDGLYPAVRQGDAKEHLAFPMIENCHLDHDILTVLHLRPAQEGAFLGLRLVGHAEVQHLCQREGHGSPRPPIKAVRHMQRIPFGSTRNSTLYELVPL